MGFTSFVAASYSDDSGTTSTTWFFLGADAYDFEPSGLYATDESPSSSADISAPSQLTLVNPFAHVWPWNEANKILEFPFSIPLFSTYLFDPFNELF